MTDTEITSQQRLRHARPTSTTHRRSTPCSIRLQSMRRRFDVWRQLACRLFSMHGRSSYLRAIALCATSHVVTMRTLGAGLDFAVVSCPLVAFLDTPSMHHAYSVHGQQLVLLVVRSVVLWLRRMSLLWWRPPLDRWWPDRLLTLVVG